jgi:hypothetical protein
MRDTFYRKHSLWLIAAVQTLCLLLGLLLQYRFVIAAASWETVEAAGATVDRENPSESPIPGAVLLEAMPLGALMAFFWIGGTQLLAFYILYSRAYDRNFQQQIQALERSLLQERDLIRTRNAVIFGLAKLAESRDTETGHHLERIALYSTRLAEELRRYPHFKARINDSFLSLIGISSALHDIGKVGVEDCILKKPGPLTADERRRMEQHTRLGGDCIHEIEIRLGNSNFLQMAHHIALYHHERWDGTGYPFGLRGEEIPLAARIVAVADVYDALSSERVYKEAFPHEECVENIRSAAGKHFDPEIVKVFLRTADRFQQIARRCCDPAGPAPTPTTEDAQRSDSNYGVEEELLDTVFSLTNSVKSENARKTLMSN